LRIKDEIECFGAPNQKLFLSNAFGAASDVTMANCNSAAVDD